MLLYPVPAKSQIRLLAEYLLEEITSNVVNAFLLKLKLTRNNLLLQPHWIVSLSEWKRPTKQLSHENAETPDVNWERVTGRDASQNFGCSVPYCAAVSVGPEILVVLIGKLLGESEIDDLDVACLINHDIVRFEVSVDYASGVEQLHPYQDLSAVECHPVPSLLILS